MTLTAQSAAEAMPAVASTAKARKNDFMTDWNVCRNNMQLSGTWVKINDF